MKAGRLGLLATVLSLLVCPLACGDDTKEAPQGPCPPGNMLQSGQCVPGETFEATITPEGGEQYLGGKIVLYAPPGAVTEDTTVAVTLFPAREPPASTAEGKRYLSAAVEFGPAGTTFAEPVTFAVPTTSQLPEGSPLAVLPLEPAAGLDPKPASTPRS